ncbi:ATP-dependent nuclease [Chondromyces apiculatus]|uniref:ATP-dependent nuclease n=1 Tax=Chondromyces apiculatus TaxID=51 RepID=UPI0005C5EAD5|nr:AAA family ATPase [Chondromyces apiculatus]
MLDKEGWIVLWWDYPIRDDEAFLPTTRAEELFTDKLTDEGIAITLTFDADSTIQRAFVSLSYGRNEALKLTVKVQSAAAMQAIEGVPPKSKHLSRLLHDALRDKEPIAVFVPSFYGATRHEAFSSGAWIERHLESGGQGRIVRNLLARLDGAALKELNDALRMSVNAEIIKSTSTQELDAVQYLQAQFRDSNGNLELASAGTGLIALVALFSSLKWYQSRKAQGRPLLFLLDEPEAHLHPRLQGDTGARIADLVTGFGAQVVMATHSIEMINRLGQRDDAVLLSVDRSSPVAATELAGESGCMEALRTFCDLSPFASLQLLKSRKICFHEGKTDRVILERCAAVYFANDKLKHDRFRSWTFAELTGVDNAEAKDVLKKAIAPLFKDSPGSGPVRIIRILDRDYHRTPTIASPQLDKAAGIEEVGLVWSRHSIECLFLDKTHLTAWIRQSLPASPAAPSEAQLLQWVEEAIEAANRDDILCRDAAFHLAPVWIRLKPASQATTTKAFYDACQQAEQEVRSHPEVWQQGHARADFILKRVREKLPLPLQNKVKSDIPNVVRAKVSAAPLVASTLIPDEVRKLLDYMGT